MSFMILNEDEALKKYLKGITVSDGGNSSRPVKVFFQFRDVETDTLNETEYPFTLISLVDMYPDMVRKHSGGRYLTTEHLPEETAPQTNISIMVRNTPVPYMLVYQVMTFARHPRHDREILQKYSRKFPANDGVMPLAEPTLSDIYRPLFLQSFSKRTSVEGSGAEARRVYRNVWTLHVPTELDPDIVEPTLLVQTPQLNVPPAAFVSTNYDKP